MGDYLGPRSVLDPYHNHGPCIMCETPVTGQGATTARVYRRTSTTGIGVFCGDVCADAFEVILGMAFTDEDEG